MIEHQLTRLSSVNGYDVAVIGAGIGGLGACIFLAQAGMRVICIEPEPFPHNRVGESLDWSMPALMRSLGVQPHQLVGEQFATQKNKIKVCTQDGATVLRSPDSWPIRLLSNMKEDTLHVDRAAFDQRLFEVAQTLGVVFLWDRVSGIEKDGDRVVACHTASDNTARATWFIDASGRARLFAQAFGIPRHYYGRQKVCIWTCADLVSTVRATTFYTNPQTEYLSWIWEIPITPHSVSLGYVARADEIQWRRRNGQSAEQILTSELGKFGRFDDVIAKHPRFRVRTTAFQGYVSARASGANWLLVGEAAAMADPLTGNGVTAALRHARAAAAHISDAKGKTMLAGGSRYIHDASIRAMADIYNRSIEEALYGSPLRLGLGIKTAVTVYVFVGFFSNAFYSRFEPHDRFGLLLLRIWLVCMRVWIAGWVWLGRLACKGRQRRTDQRFHETIAQ